MRIVTLALVPLLGCNEPSIQPLPSPTGVTNGIDLGPEWQTDRITQVTEEKVDVLFVVDNSCSMLEEQAALGSNFDFFIDWFVDSPLDWHVGVISTDMANPGHSGHLRRAGSYAWVDRDTPQPAGVFASMTALGNTGSNDEMGLAASMAALTDPLVQGQNGGFYRDEAGLFLVFVSDADDFSASPTLPEYRNWLGGLKGDVDDVSVSAIAATPRSGCVIESVSNTYLDLVNRFGGTAFDICQSDWAPVLDTLGATAAGLRSLFYLTDLPVEDTLEAVITEGDRVTLGFPAGTDCDSCVHFVYEAKANAIAFVDYVPSADAHVEIRYQLLRSGELPQDDEPEAPSTFSSLTPLGVDLPPSWRSAASPNSGTGKPGGTVQVLRADAPEWVLHRSPRDSARCALREGGEPHASDQLAPGRRPGCRV
jgi:hypothetical protein